MKSSLQKDLSNKECFKMKLAIIQIFEILNLISEGKDSREDYIIGAAGD